MISRLDTSSLHQTITILISAKRIFFMTFQPDFIHRSLQELSFYGLVFVFRNTGLSMWVVSENNHKLCISPIYHICICDYIPYYIFWHGSPLFVFVLSVICKFMSLSAIWKSEHLAFNFHKFGFYRLNSWFGRQRCGRLLVASWIFIVFHLTNQITSREITW